MLRVLDLYYKVAIFQLELWKCTSRARVVPQSCECPTGAAEVCFVVTRLVLESGDLAGAAEVHFAH